MIELKKTNFEELIIQEIILKLSEGEQPAY